MSRRRRMMRRKHGQSVKVLLRLAVVGLVATLLIALAGVATAYAYVQTWLKDLPDYESPTAFQVAQPTLVYSADGKLLASFYLENRTVVKFEEISQDLKDATVAVEDERFYQHPGIDIAGIARAAVKDIIAGSAEEGASTITQQYVRNTVLADEQFDISFARKVREMFIARELEKRRSKDEILNLYLNGVYFGEGAYGVEAASQTYFSKRCSELSLAESALLAGLPQAPSRLGPYDNMEGAKRRQAEVLDAMVENGYITAAAAAEAKDAPLRFERLKRPDQGIYQAHYFVAHVRKELLDRYPLSVVFKGGLQVYTTLDTKRQRYAENAVFNSLNRADDPDCALTSIDPRNGHIVAMVGGENYAVNKFNLATQGKRQPGSSFKTFVLVTALENGMPPNRYIDGSSPAYIATGGRPWHVTGGSGGYITLAAATHKSVNCAYARLIKELGAEKVALTAKRMGITTKIPALYSIALGSQNVSTLEMASAYGTLANNGVYVAPTPITKIVGPDGEVLFEHKVAGKQAISPSIAYATTQVLKGVITGGTGTGARIGRPAAGKTGTSQSMRDAWFCGYTPQLSTAVWVGYYKREIPMYTVHGIRGYGGKVAAPIWAKYMKPAMATEPKIDFKAFPAPKYKWKSAWAARKKATSATVAPTKPAPKPTPQPVPEPTPEPEPEPPPEPPPSEPTTP
ncbi:MAG: PBP1A family penicillin-binding protein [Actinobacteria bacterium]|nr:MAG: PBP1A family penicillin-binding protein [Actinomycetota bacterium]